MNVFLFLNFWVNRYNYITFFNRILNVKKLIKYILFNHFLKHGVMCHYWLLIDFSPSMEVPMLLFLDICRQCNRRQIQGFGVEYVVVFAKTNNNYVETEMGIVKKAFWAVACSNFIAYLSEWHFC